MESSYINPTYLAKYWLENYGEQVVTLKRNQQEIQSLKLRWETALRKDTSHALIMAFTLREMEEKQLVNRILADLFSEIWQSLTKQEKRILELIHRRGLPRMIAYQQIAVEMHCSETTARRRYQKALSRFYLLMMGF